ncbi:hypothetical protein V4V51_003769 [Vibrio mimicus]
MSNYATLVDVLITDETKGIKNHERILELGCTPDILLRECGFPDLPLVIKASTISKICFDHGVPTSMIKRLPEIVSNPKSLFRSASVADSVVVVTFEIKGGAPIIVPIRKAANVGRRKCNVVTSMYAKEGKDPETKWTQENLLIWTTL